ncbi:hypothetical protein [Pseudooceanicola algae]|uniref:Uncharacterized protein n=1 Tax=Pseudooceanicola algae TaxID=1537215 RepID=A0A418SJ81_9RHOB|nr:hypothetical protein [Pseudooceanicola algae]QPM90160.1 hypothetical protein PSAL_013950 [Pseudooceanicola algae]
MTDLLFSARPVTPTEVRAVPTGKEANPAAMQDPAGAMPPVQAPEELEKAGLQPLPLPERRPILALAAAEDGDGEVALQVRPDEDRAAVTLQHPSRVDPMSLFQGLIASAAQSGAKAPGTSARLYALVQQIYSVMEGAQQSSVH